MEHQINNNEIVNLIGMTCLNEGHEGSKLVALCVDKTCSISNKFVCLECIFQNHEQHKIIKLKVIQDRINQNLEIEQKDSQNLVLHSKLKETEEKVMIEIEKIKTNILEILNNKVNKFITEINDKVLNINEQQASENFDFSILTRKELKHLTKEEMEKLLNYLNNNYVNKGIESSIIVNEPIKKKSAVTELEKAEENYCKYIQDINKMICDLLNNKNSHSSVVISENVYFEWSEKTFANYGFLYNLSNNKLTAHKTLNDGTITILRAKDKLSLSDNYYIEFLIDCKKGGDIEVGIGREQVGPSCWLRCAGAYGISNVGIYECGKLVKKEEKIEDGNIIALEIYLKNPINKHGKIIKNGKMVHEFKIDIDEIFPLAAIRKIGNSVTVKDFKIINLNNI